MFIFQSNNYFLQLIINQKKQTMEFIQITSKRDQRKDFGHFESILLKKIIDEYQYSIHSLNSQDLEIISLITRIQDISVSTKIFVQQQSYLSITFTFFENYLLKFKTLHSKGIMLKQFLTLNNRLIKHFLHPISGQLILRLNMNFSNIYIGVIELIQTISVLINKLMQYCTNQFKNIFRLMFNRNEVNYNESRQLERLKKIIKTSSYYGFTMLKTTTHSKKQNTMYEDLKKEFIQMYKYQKYNQFISSIGKTLNFENQNIKPYQIFTTEQELNLKEKNIPRLQQNPKALLINQITLSQSNLKKLFQEQLAKVQCHQFGKINLYIESYPQAKIPALNYERQILSKLPKNEYMGFVRYYIIKNYKALTANCVITNLTSGVKYYEFLENNKNTISIFTKLHILHQISLILKYLTKNNIVYHNAQPKNLYIRKGMYVKATDFTNAFHNEISLLDYKRYHNPWKSVMPYVSNYGSNINNSYGDEKSDVFSLGILMYETIYGKTPLFRKRGKQQETYWMQKLLSPLIIGIQKKNEEEDRVIQLMTYLMLECIRHEKSSRGQNMNSIEQKNLINLKSRPYLDWIIISLKLIMELYKRNYN